MPASQHILPSKDKDAAAVLVELLKPGAWIPPAHARWLPIIEALLEAFLRHFDRAVLAQLLDHQRALPPSASAAARAARMAGELTALHKICQMLARNPHIPAEARAALAPLESLPPEAISDTALSAAVALAAQVRPDLELDPENPKVARGSVADVFRFRDRTSEGTAIAFKTVRADSLRLASSPDPISQPPWRKRFEMRLARYTAKSTSSGRRRICGRRAPFTNSTAASVSLQPSASQSIGESLWSWSRAFRFSTLHSTTNPGAMLPDSFFDA
jgi:hypothetical protein